MCTKYKGPIKSVTAEKVRQRIKTVSIKTLGYIIHMGIYCMHRIAFATHATEHF